MNADFVEFRRGVISPLECIKEGWALIKDQYWLFFGIAIVSLLIGSAFAIVLMGPMMVGLFICLQQRQRNQPVEFGLLFKGFDLFLPGLIVTVLKFIPMFVIIVPYYIFLAVMMVSMQGRHMSSPDDANGVVMSMFAGEIVFFLAIMAVSLVTEIFFLLAYPLIADKRMSGLDAVKLSFRAARANLGGIIGLLLLNGLFGFIGVLCCIVGVYFYLPVAFASHAVAYRRIFPDTGTHLPSPPPPPPPPGNWA
jgi:hypothetical protein